MTNEKAIRIISNYDALPCGYCHQGGKEIEEAFNLAIEALKEQDPIKPIVDVDTWACGKCGHRLEKQELIGDNVLVNETYEYCPQCGRKVDWNG